jgi:hypothetical protein
MLKQLIHRRKLQLVGTFVGYLIAESVNPFRRYTFLEHQLRKKIMSNMATLVEKVK